MSINQSGVLNIQEHRVLKRGLNLTYWLDLQRLVRYQLLSLSISPLSVNFEVVRSQLSLKERVISQLRIEIITNS